MGYVTSC